MAKSIRDTARQHLGYSPEAGNAICALIIERVPIRQIGAREGFPSETTIYRWLAEHEEFQEQYARARALQHYSFEDEIIEISDESSGDWVERQVGEETIKVVDHEHIQRSKLRVDTRKWLMSKMAPKKYGDRAHIEHSGTLAITQLPDAALDERIVAELMATGLSEEAARAFVAKKAEG